MTWGEAKHFKHKTTKCHKTTNSPISPNNRPVRQKTKCTDVIVLVVVQNGNQFDPFFTFHRQGCV